MAEERTNYHEKAEDDAKDAVENFLEEIVEDLLDKGEAKDSLYDYAGGDSYHHENHTDRSYSLLEAAELLDQLSEHEETDSGLWDGMEPREAVKAQAAYTYGNAVMSDFRDLIVNINDEARETLDELAEKKTELEERQTELEAEEGTEEWTEKKAKELKTLESRLEAFDRVANRRVERAVLEAIGRKPKQPHGPREWQP